MTAELDTAEARASRQATDWLILLQEEPADVGLRDRFEDWRAADPVNAAAWTATQRTATIMARVPPAGAAAPLVADCFGAPGDEGGGRTTGDRRRANVRRLAALGAVAIAACIGLLAAPAIVLQWRADHATGTAEVRILRLDDGSTLALAPESAIQVAYTGSERRVMLLAGEAFFEVAPDAGRPFRVVAGGIETTDLGTAFDVQRGEVGATIAVQSGSVRVDYPAAKPAVSETLVEGQSIRVDWTGNAQRSEQVPAQIAAWRHRQLIAQDEPMADVIDRLRPYFSGRIVVLGPDLARQRVAGVYNLREPADALRGIAEAKGATVREITPWLLVVTGR